MIKMLIGLRNWIDARFPLSELWNEHLAQYYAPKNFNFWYFFGSLALLGAEIRASREASQ